VRETKGNFVVSLEGVSGIDRAEELRGLDVVVPESEVPPLPEGEYYHYQILGLPVYNYKGILLGKVVDIFTAGVKDVYVVKGQGKSI
jgi:16S rRNA processing protein RimM